MISRVSFPCYFTFGSLTIVTGGGAEGLVSVVGTSSPDASFPRRLDISLVNSSPSFSWRRSAELLLKLSPCSTNPYKITSMRDDGNVPIWQNCSILYAYKQKIDAVIVFKNHTMKTYGEVHVKLHTFLTFKLDEDKWSALCFRSFTTGERVFGTQWIQGL